MSSKQIWVSHFLQRFSCAEYYSVLSVSFNGTTALTQPDRNEGQDQRLNILSEAQGPTENFLTVWLKFRIEIKTVDLNINYTFYPGKIHGCHAIFCEKSKISRGRPLLIIIYFIRLESNPEPDLQSYMLTTKPTRQRRKTPYNIKLRFARSFLNVNFSFLPFGGTVDYFYTSDKIKFI